jgi:hypothetical protein
MTPRLRRGLGALPTFFIIGAPKTGTTSLYHYLDQHSEVQMSAIKEPSFFAWASTSTNDYRKVKNLDEYEQLFDPAVTIRGEASPNYAMYPLRQGVPERIRALIPHAKLIYLVRDPVDRTVSHYHQLVATQGEKAPLEEVLSDLSDPRSPCVCGSLYAMQLELYLRNFPQKHMLVVDQAELLTERRATLSKIFAFLEVDNSFDTPSFDDELLKSSERHIYPPVFSRFVGHTVRPRSRWLSPRIRQPLRRAIERFVLPPLETSTLSSDLRIQLEEFYATDVQRLRTLTGKAFSTWSI